MRGSELVARAGDLYAIDADEAHAGRAVDAQGWRQRTFHVDLAHLGAIAGAVAGLATDALRYVGVGLVGDRKRVGEPVANFGLLT